VVNNHTSSITKVAYTTKDFYAMPAHCAAYGCKTRNVSGSYSKFFRFPRDPERRQQWVNAIKRKDFVPTEHSRICSKHFVTGTYKSMYMSLVVVFVVVPRNSLPDILQCINIYCKFCYLGHILSLDGDTDAAVKARI